MLYKVWQGYEMSFMQNEFALTMKRFRVSKCTISPNRNSFGNIFFRLEKKVLPHILQNMDEL